MCHRTLGKPTIKKKSGARGGPVRQPGKQPIVLYLLTLFSEKAAADLYLNLATSPDHLADNTPAEFRRRYFLRDVRT